MIEIVLTGSIGMGKSTTARLFAKQGIPGFDADQAVHQLYSQNGAAIAPIKAWLPEVIKNGAVSRERLGAHLAKNPEDFADLETIVHPLVAAKRKKWRLAQKTKGQQIVLYDIPLYFEAKRQQETDFVVLVSAPLMVQKARVLARPGMSEKKWQQIMGRQMPDTQKRQNSDYIIRTDKGIADADLQVQAILRHITKTAVFVEKNHA
ncbi:Dephospho-CoA kinase [hydrothermal vent metagenome]|uniref:Dephospho-CoA kinase n=1 Tax=hydrothermal vent metagenome TaxID=652676 RepID=A0A3B0RRK1_9ZZZZ